MPQGAPSRLDDTVGVAVVNYRLPVLPDQQAVVANAHKIRQMIEGMKWGLPGLDLVIFPEYSVFGLDARLLPASPGCLGAAETEVLSQACRNARVWGVFSSAGAAAAGRLILVNDEGALVQARAGLADDGPLMVMPGPKGLTLGLIVGGHEQGHVAIADAARQGAELVVCGLGRSPSTEHLAVPTSRQLASTHGVYLAMASLTGLEGAPEHAGHSAIVGFNGEVLADSGNEPYGVRHAALSPRLLRDHRCRGAWPMGQITSASSGLRSPPAGGLPAVARPAPRP